MSSTPTSFRFVGDYVRHAWVVMLAIETFCYGIFMIAQGVAYDPDSG